ncbi:MFS transporter [Hoylesella timonensis]|uniref:MFS transporter n=1 Tax=Hoylesella timonensis TaxID=386414 RepID=A0A2K0XMD9_9BACT|nr:MFS transporter [Hoylesella timonensis]PNP95696.1 MFS transporter [Hoylesella timonensis]
MNLKEKKYYPWLVVALLWVVALLNYMDRQMLSTMQESMKVDIVELNKAEAFGALMAVFLWIYGLVSPFAGMIADRVSRKWLVVGSLFVWSGVTYLMGYAENFTQLYWLRAFMGVSEALYIPSALSLIADWHEGKSRSLAIGIHMTGLYTGQAIGGFGATIAAMFTWHSAFHWFGIIGVVYSIVLLLFLYENPSHAQSTSSTTHNKASINPFKGLSIVLSNWAFWIILFYFAVPSLPGWATKNWLPTLFATNLGIDMSSAGPLSTITIAVSSFVGVIVGGIMSDRWVQRNIRGRIYTSAIGLGMTIPALILLGFGHHIVAIVGAGLCFGVGYGIFDANNMPILCQFISTKHRGTAYGIMNMVGVFAGALVTQVLGKWSDGGNLGLGFAILGGIVVIALILQLACLKPTTDNAS